MRVLHVVRQFHPSVGGMEEVVLNIARQHVKTGGVAEILSLDRLFTAPGQRLPARDEVEGIPVRRIGYAGSSRYPLAPSVLSGLADADLVHVHGIDFFYDYLAMTRMLHRRPLIASTHGGFFHTGFASSIKQAWFRTMTRASASAYARIVATSENDGLLFSRVVAARRLRVIENGVDVDKFAGMACPSPGRTLLFFGRWSANKGLPETLELLRALRERDPRWRLIVAGREYDLDRPRLLHQSRSLGLDAAVELVVAPDLAQLRALIARSQFFVCLSRHEGFGLAAVEAMSAGLLPVLSDIPPFRRLHRESGTGVLVSPAQAEQAADRVQDFALRGDPELARWQLACRRFSDRYAWDSVAARYFDEYRQALSPRSRRGAAA
ncbi:glycosyltransferase family 4 protein [Luteimonas kalidii]|uniref:Glycosyltransferase family 4 protein n=1 Tax=Luteimonas kalidii TaxID=3042025 RepID=A0ABT6JY04_9GAMM|nr:glycosyltransferase family 4 protein [Luteimonas kalidii]MDH5835571.1 glycosyltransferase family 4 protein [Luteimonas kalidii]